MPMPGRSYQSSNSYRYGYNGKENDPETIGTGSGTQDYGMRIYNPSLGKFLSSDPIARNFPWNSCYAYAENSPIVHIDLDGLEKIKFGSVTVDFTKMKTEDDIEKVLELYYSYHQGNLDASEILEKYNDNEVWSVRNSTNIFNKSTGTTIDKYSSEAGYKGGKGKPFSQETVRDLSQWLYAKDSQFDGKEGMKDGLLFGASVVGTVLSGGALGAAELGTMAGVITVASFVGNVDGLTTGPDGQSFLESLGAKLGGDNGEKAVKFTKLAFGIADLRNGLSEFAGTLWDGTKVSGTWDNLNNVFSSFDVVKTITDEATPQPKK